MSTHPKSELVRNAESGSVESKALAQSADWQSVLTHFDFHEDFAFGLLLVPGDNLANACREDLERHLALSGKLLLDLSPASPEELLPRCLSLARQPFGPEAGVIWISAVVSEYQTDFPAWNAAFQNAFARLNPVRNILQHHLPCTLLFAGAPWVQSVIRTMAPDLWSVRSLVTTLANVPRLSNSDSLAPLSISSDTSADPDPEFALSEAASLRGKAGHETALIRLLDRAGQGFSARFRFDDAARALREALELRRSLKLPSVEIARAEIALATALIEPGHHAAGMPHVETALALLDNQDIGNDPVQLDALDSVATLLGKAGRGQAAKDLREWIVATAQGSLGPEDPRTLIYMGNLGSTLSRLGDLTRARSIEEQVFEISKRLLGPDHVITLTAMNNLGETLRRLNDFAGARSLAEYVFEANRRLIGPDHVQSLILMNNFATILADDGDLAGALALGEQVLEGLSKSVGSEYRDALTVRHNIAIYLERQGDLAGAREQMERVLEARLRLFGPAHGDTITAMRTLARIYTALGQTAEANALLEEVGAALNIPPSTAFPNPRQDEQAGSGDGECERKRSAESEAGSSTH